MAGSPSNASMVDMHSESLRGTCAARTSVVLDRLDEASTGQFRQSYASAAKSSLAGAVGLRLDSPSTDGVAVHVLLGSPDPHGLQLTERSAPVRKKPMYGSLAHAEAEEEELMGRPFAHLNVPPPTPPHDPPEPTAGLPPSVDSIEQILPRHTRAIVNAWRRRLRRCLRYAAAGDVRMARRLRPKDLWLPAEYHMEPEARAYDWDLRPLARGEAAIPWEISGRDGVRPASALDAAAVLSGADGFADEGIVSEMLSGIEDDACCERGSLLCAPHASALAHSRRTCLAGRFARALTAWWMNQRERARSSGGSRMTFRGLRLARSTTEAVATSRLSMIRWIGGGGRLAGLCA